MRLKLFRVKKKWRLMGKQGVSDRVSIVFFSLSYPRILQSQYGTPCILKMNVVQATVYKTVNQIVDAYKGIKVLQ